MVRICEYGCDAGWRQSQDVFQQGRRSGGGRHVYPGKGTTIWIGGEFGLEFFDGSRFQSVTPSDGSAFGGVPESLAILKMGFGFPKIGESFTFAKLSFGS